jgi:hypothetical protein
MRINILLIAMTLMGSCAYDEHPGANVCTHSGPIEEIPWVAALKNSIQTNCACATSIIRGTYDNQTVIYVLENDPLCDGIKTTPTFYNCEGQKIRSFTDSKAEVDSVLYNCKNITIDI